MTLVLSDAVSAAAATRASGPGSIRVGVDLTRVGEVAESIERFGSRYLERLFTEHELASCRGRSDRGAAGLAARFAAKEATIKVLQPTGARPAWTAMEVRRAPSGACSMRLTDAAEHLARDAGITELAVSLSHEGDLAAAVVIALVDGETR